MFLSLPRLLAGHRAAPALPLIIFYYTIDISYSLCSFINDTYHVVKQYPLLSRASSSQVIALPILFLFDYYGIETLQMLSKACATI
jgi:hypothetical protein